MKKLTDFLESLKFYEVYVTLNKKDGLPVLVLVINNLLQAQELQALLEKEMYVCTYIKYDDGSERLSIDFSVSEYSYLCMRFRHHLADTPIGPRYYLVTGYFDDSLRKLSVCGNLLLQVQDLPFSEN